MKYAIEMRLIIKNFHGIENKIGGKDQNKIGDRNKIDNYKFHEIMK